VSRGLMQEEELNNLGFHDKGMQKRERGRSYEGRKEGECPRSSAGNGRKLSGGSYRHPLQARASLRGSVLRARDTKTRKMFCQPRNFVCLVLPFISCDEWLSIRSPLG
jgi:hypothetical protein